MKFSILFLTSTLLSTTCNAFVAFVPSSSGRTIHHQQRVVTTTIKSSFQESAESYYEGQPQAQQQQQEQQQQQQQQQQPTTFRESEVLGLRLMQEGLHEDALRVFQQGMKLPGSRPDVVRTKTLSGPSPVGGSLGGTEGKQIMILDEFETQAAHYNIACAHSRLGNVQESLNNLQLAFQAGFDNYGTVRVDPDLAYIQEFAEFEDLMSQFERKGFFGIFGKK